jgi:carboxyl-terminal processing protease
MLFAFVVTVGLVWSSPVFAQGAPTNCSVVSQNLYVRDQLADIYYWNQFLTPNVNPASFASPEAYLEAVRYRPIDNYYSYIQPAAANAAFYGDSAYVGLGFATILSPTDLTVLQVYPDSPGTEAGLERGARFIEINGRTVTSMIADGSIGGAFGASDLGVVADIVFETRAGVRKSAHMVKRVVTIPTVSLTRVFDVDGRRVGYIFFRNFVTPSYAALDDAFASLKAAGANELVLDLRYNGGGLVDVAVHLASLIGGTRTAGQPMVVYTHNTKNSALNKTTRFEAASVNALSLSKLTVIATRSTASSSELVINALRPYMPVAIIGDTTYGKPVGQYVISFCDKVLVPVSFSLRNALNQGDFFDGMPPTCQAPDDSTHDLGDAAEGSLAEAMTYIRTSACTPSSTSLRALRAAWPSPRPTLDGFRLLINAQ